MEWECSLADEIKRGLHFVPVQITPSAGKIKSPANPCLGRDGFRFFFLGEVTHDVIAIFSIKNPD
ncbi:MAG: hypothetical protein M1358_06595 [Chloroflexi bacterium]|nr:hypothetical protein [Chloroflexota bacterium]